MKLCAPNRKCIGVTIDGKNPCDISDCPGLGGGHFDYPYPTQQRPCPPRPRICPPPEPPAGHWEYPGPQVNWQNVQYPTKYCPGYCDRPCCRHSSGTAGGKPVEPCCYDDPCKAQCFNHPPGIKPSGRYPPPYYRGPLGRCNVTW